MSRILLLGVLLALAACGGEPMKTVDGEGLLDAGIRPSNEDFMPLEPAGAEPSLEGKTWVLKLWVSDKGIPEVPPNTAVFTLRFDGSELSGQLDCNSLTGRYRLLEESETLQLTELSATEIACPEAHGGASERFFNRLATSNRYAWSGADLVLAGPMGAKLVFEQEHPGCAEALKVPEAALPEIVTVTAVREANAAQIAAELEASRPDFILMDHGDCSRSFTASVNRQTLGLIRCRSDVQTISF